MTKKTIWNWQQDDWPNFQYDTKQLIDFENKFLRQSGVVSGLYKHISAADQKSITVKLICNEAIKTSEIEGEFLDRASLQSSIKRYFGLAAPLSRNHPAENGIAEMMTDLYYHYKLPLTHEVLWKWHAMLMSGRRDLHDIGRYRTHIESMQIISGAIHNPKVHFEAPPSKQVMSEMDAFINWFNTTAPNGEKPLPPLIRAGIAHLYFVSIHPFEDGNGRIGRTIVEKIMAQYLQQPTLIAISQAISSNKKAYYSALEIQNKSNKITDFLIYFSKTILLAQEYTIAGIEFIIKKTKFFDQFANKMNPRQHKVIFRMLREGPKGFTGGLSADNYTKIAKTSPSTATRDLKDLVEKQILRKTGKLKATRYWLCFMDE
ncbi:MAG: Fic family protein [Pseudomonadota bacterium]